MSAGVFSVGERMAEQKYVGTYAYRGGDINGRAGWWVHFPYDLALIDRVKAEIPAAERSYSGLVKEWWISEAVTDLAIKIVPALEAFLHQPTFPGMDQ